MRTRARVAVALLLLLFLLAVSLRLCWERQRADWFSGLGSVCDVASLAHLGPPSERRLLAASQLSQLQVGPHQAIDFSEADALQGIEVEVLLWRQSCLSLTVCEAIAVVYPPTGRILLFSFWQRFHGAGIIGPSPPLDLEESIRNCGPLPIPVQIGEPE